jgi:broad specificity phosphatase PhoE
VTADDTRDQYGTGDCTTVYLARHGQTPLNQTDVLRGMANPSLDEAGRQQARRLGAALAGLSLSAVIASPLRRAVQTAAPAAEHAGLPVVEDQLLVDRDYGPWTGISKHDVTARWGSVDDAPGVEPASAVRERALAGLAAIARRHHGGTVVVVSHDAVNRQVLTALDASLGDPTRLPQENGCFNRLELRDGKWTVCSVNEIPV